MEEDEDDIWDYRSIKKVKLSEHKSSQLHKSDEKGRDTQAPTFSKQKRRSQVMCKKSQSKKTPVKKDSSLCLLSKASRTPEKPNGVCPNCQVPFACLGILSPSWHVTECLESGSPLSVECPDGLMCNNTIESHYRQFSHHALAIARSTASQEMNEHPEGVSERRVSRKELKFPDEDLVELNREPKIEVNDSVVEEDRVSDAGSEDLLSQRSLSDILDAAQSESDIDKVSSDEESEDKGNDNERLNFDLETGENRLPLEEQMSRDFFSGGDDTEEVKRLDIDDIFDNNDSTLGFFSKEESTPGYKTCIWKESNSKKIIQTEDSCEMETKYGQNADEIQGSGSRKLDKNFEEVNYISDSDSDFQECVDSVSLSQKMQWAKILTPQKCSQSSGNSQGSSEKNLSQKSTGETAKLPLKSNSGRKRKNLLDAREKNLNTCTLNKLNPKGKLLVNKTTEVKNKNKQTSLASFFCGKNVRSSRAEKTTQVISDLTVVDCKTEVEDDLQTKKSQMSKGNSKRVGLHEVTNKVHGSTGQVLVPPAEDLNALKRSPKSRHGDKQNNCSNSGSCDAMTERNDIDKSSASHQAMDKMVSAKPCKPNAIEVLMSKQKKTKLETCTSVAEASELTIPEAKNLEKPSRYRKRNCPFYKKIPDTGFTVDAFSYGEIPGCTGYILSHFHYDHYNGLTKSFSQPMYCSKITANLVLSKIKVKETFVKTLPLNKPTIVNGVELTFLEANHCPGSVLILFKLRDGRAFLHTGDFRAVPSMEKYPSLVGIRISQLYLDTTYCNPTYAFPPQSEVIDFTVSLVQRELKRTPNTLIVCGSYTIGKERIFMAVAEALGCKICVLRDKKNVLDCLEDSSLQKRISLNFNDSCLHVLHMGKLNPKALMEHAGKLTRSYTNILALEPTGWTFSKINTLQEIRPKYNREGIKIFGIPYSEHSSYLELQRFVQFIKPLKVIPTVNVGNPSSRAKMNQIFEEWQRGTTRAQRKNTQTSIESWTCQ